MSTCPFCSEEIAAETSQCPSCGAEFIGSMVPRTGSAPADPQHFLASLVANLKNRQQFAAITVPCAFLGAFIAPTGFSLVAGWPNHPIQWFVIILFWAVGAAPGLFGGWYVGICFSSALRSRFTRRFISGLGYVLGFSTTVSLFAARLIRKVLPGKKTFLCVAAVLLAGVIVGSAGACIAGGLMLANGVSGGPLFFCGGSVVLYISWIVLRSLVDIYRALVGLPPRSASFGKNAPLIHCEACGEQVSRNASACPTCGEPAPGTTYGVVWWLATSGFLLGYLWLDAEHQLAHRRARRAVEAGNANEAGKNAFKAVRASQKKSIALGAAIVTGIWGLLKK